MNKVIKLGQIFELEGKQFILAHVDCRKYNLVGITRGFFTSVPVEFDDYYKTEFTETDMRILSVMRFNDLIMIPQNIKLCDYFNQVCVGDLNPGEKFYYENNKNDIYQKIDNNNGYYNVLSLSSFKIMRLENTLQVTKVQE